MTRGLTKLTEAIPLAGVDIRIGCCQFWRAGRARRDRIVEEKSSKSEQRLQGQRRKTVSLMKEDEQQRYTKEFRMASVK